MIPADWINDNGASAISLRRPQPMVPMVASNIDSGAPAYVARTMSAADLKKPGVMAMRSNSHYAPNGPFIQAKAWVVK